MGEVALDFKQEAVPTHDSPRKGLFTAIQILERNENKTLIRSMLKRHQSGVE